MLKKTFKLIIPKGYPENDCANILMCYPVTGLAIPYWIINIIKSRLSLLIEAAETLLSKPDRYYLAITKFRH